MIDMYELERLAKAATPGPWEYRDLDGTSAVAHPHGWVDAILPSGAQENADAQYIASANPAVITQLIGRLRKAEEVGDRILTLFAAIKHGDDAHQAWLDEAIEAHFAGRRVPPIVLRAPA